MITIDGTEYTKDDLTDDEQSTVGRIIELQAELNRHQMAANEAQILISVYSNSIRQGVEGRKLPVVVDQDAA